MTFIIKYVSKVLYFGGKNSIFKTMFSTSEKRIIVATDLDGTILNDEKIISSTDVISLKSLGERNFIRVAATGRSMHKVIEVLNPDHPFDYIVFSSGGGVYDWKKHEILTFESFKNNTLKSLIEFMLTAKLNFFVYEPIPRNNFFLYHEGAGPCPEYSNYLNRHAGDHAPLTPDNQPEEAGQLMAVIPNDTRLFEKIKSEILAANSGIKVIRTTSPVDKNYTWIEIFPDTVSKGHGIKWLCSYLNIDYENTIGIGNDFNDLDMLEFVKHPYVLGNSPDQLKDLFTYTEKTNEESGFSEVLKIMDIL
ncbi:MAG: HAD hydrolase family protein [Prolixibacteraceae bacterium]|nr:HAD hydrolase family protein [Prolixibacteraceae bacterium]